VVLVVEDEAALRLVITEYLRDCGFTVEEAGDAKQAVRMIEGGGAVDVVFTDVRMPGSMEGFGLARWIRENRPGLPVIVTSGAAQRAQIARELSAGEPFVRKPYDQSEVERVILALLSNRRDGPAAPIR
jgi:CheY-like chemotaxis protein